MAHLEEIETTPDATRPDGKRTAELDALFWWHREQPPVTDVETALVERLHGLSERAATPPLDDGEPPLPGNRMRANAARFRIIASIPKVATTANDQIDPELREAIRIERRSATLAVGTGLFGTLMAAAATAYAATTQEITTLAFAVAGMIATSFALYHATRWLKLMRSDAVPKFI